MFLQQYFPPSETISPKCNANRASEGVHEPCIVSITAQLQFSDPEGGVAITKHERYLCKTFHQQPHNYVSTFRY